jgi:hypothetical protein
LGCAVLPEVHDHRILIRRHLRLNRRQQRLIHGIVPGPPGGNPGKQRRQGGRRVSLGHAHPLRHARPAAARHPQTLEHCHGLFQPPQTRGMAAMAGQPPKPRAIMPAIKVTGGRSTPPAGKV